MCAACVYILYSLTLDKHYIGATQLPAHERFEQHLAAYYPGQFTAAATDWEVKFIIDCEHFPQALAVEKHIKRMKSRKYIENLMRYPEIAARLLLQYA